MGLMREWIDLLDGRKWRKNVVIKTVMLGQWEIESAHK